MAHITIFAWGIILSLALGCGDVRGIRENFGLAGALDQWADRTDILSSAGAVCHRVGRVFDGTE